MDGYPILQALIKANSPEKHPELQKLFKDTLKLTSVFDITRLTEASFKKKVGDAINRDNTLKEHASSIDIGKLYDNAKCLALHQRRSEPIVSAFRSPTPGIEG